jgi:Xaa-Pro aminopeptidase
MKAQNPRDIPALWAADKTVATSITAATGKCSKESICFCAMSELSFMATADVTRTLPVDGHFSEEEKAIYELVLIAQNAGIEQCRVGNKFWGPDKAAKDVLAQGLKSLGIITGSSDVKHYFFHGTSHYMGLDVHDSGLRGFLKAGNVITVEPGIYIPEGSDCDPKWWNIGIRIEDDILITPAGPENLSISSPRTVAEIEALMAKESLFNLINDQ